MSDTAIATPPNTLGRLLDLGIDDATPVDLAIAIRASNWLFAFSTVLFVFGAVGSLLDAQSPLLALWCLLVALVSASCLLLSAAGLINVARWVFLLAAAAHVVSINLALGRASGAPFFFLALLGMPVIGFAQTERRQMAAAYALLAFVFVATDIASRRFGPLVLSPADAGIAYYVHLTQAAALAIFGLNHYRRSTVAARAELEAARRRIADLVDNMLPPPIALRLERGERIIADNHGEASIAFIDLAGFSTVTTRLTPAHLVDVLNSLFSRFDEAAGRYGVEKIKTIGDCYMAATGVLDGHRAARTDAIVEFAVAALAAVDDVARESGLALGARVGIATGQVVSGVIGTRRITFDVWGDTVNLAKQLESNCAPGRVLVSEATYWRLRDRYDFEPTADTAIKGGRHVPSHLLVGRRAQLEPDRNLAPVAAQR